MGNSSSSSTFWPPTKLFNRKSKPKNSKKRKSQHVNTAPPVAPMYDTVADFPVYSVVEKKRPNNIKVEENVQYAEIEVVRQPPHKSPKKPAIMPKPKTTEYATLNFPAEDNPTSQYASVQQISSAGQCKAPKKYNPANGTLV